MKLPFFMLKRHPPGTLYSQPVWNGWMEMVISKHFVYKDLLRHPTETTVNGGLEYQTQTVVLQKSF